MSLRGFLDGARPFPWRKAGRLFVPGGDYTHGSHPCAVHVEDDRFVFAWTRRDAKRRSHVFLCNAHVAHGRIELDEPRHALAPGAPGHFDCDGAISVCLVPHAARIHLYYVGWQNLPEGFWICDTGRAELDPRAMTLRREFAGPVLARDKDNPLFAAATAFHVDDSGRWHTWYNSGLRWEQTAQGWKHYYGIHYAESADGIRWTCHPGMCIPFADEHEYAFGRPTVIVRDGIFFMWFAHRATATVDTYRIGFAWSTDGRHWTRDDGLAGIDVSPEGWDSQMICYPCVFEHRGRYYMLYNGNNYGDTGFGYAVLEDPR